MRKAEKARLSLFRNEADTEWSRHRGTPLTWCQALVPIFLWLSCTPALEYSKPPPYPFSNFSFCLSWFEWVLISCNQWVQMSKTQCWGARCRCDNIALRKHSQAAHCLTQTTHHGQCFPSISKSARTNQNRRLLLKASFKMWRGGSEIPLLVSKTAQFHSFS